MPHLRTGCCVFIRIFHTSRYLVSQCWNDLNSDFAFRNSPGCLTHPNPASEADLRSDTKLIIASISPPLDILLRVFLLAASSTCSWICQLFLKWLQEQTEKFIMLNKRRRWFHLSRVKLPLVNKFANWILVSTYLIWIFGSKSTLSHCRTSAFNDHLDHGFTVCDTVKHGFEVRKVCACECVRGECTVYKIRLRTKD